MRVGLLTEASKEIGGDSLRAAAPRGKSCDSEPDFGGRQMLRNRTLSISRSQYKVPLPESFRPVHRTTNPYQLITGETSPSLTMSAVSRTFSSTLQHRLGVERHFALVEICQANLGLASNRCGSRTQSDPTISSISTSIMITTSNSQ